MITKEAMVWNESDQGMTYQSIPIPADLIDIVDEARGKLIEAVADYDEALLEKYFEDPDSISVDEIRVAIRKAVIDLAFTPVMCGSAFKNKGVQAVLDAVCAYLPCPLDVEAIKGINPKNDKEEERRPTIKDPFAALAFKIATDPYVGRLAFMRYIPALWMQVPMY